jgi:hypothetical protein
MLVHDLRERLLRFLGVALLDVGASQLDQDRVHRQIAVIACRHVLPRGDRCVQLPRVRLRISFAETCHASIEARRSAALLHLVVLFDRFRMASECRERASHVIARGDSRRAVWIRVRRGLQLRESGLELGFFRRKGAGGAERCPGGQILFASGAGGNDARIHRDHRFREQLGTT